MSNVPFIPFEEIKAAYTIEELMDMTGLKWKKDGQSFRTSCPVHGGGPRSLVVTPDKDDDKGGRGCFYCFGAKVGGDRVALLAHVRDSKPYAVFKELAERKPSAPAVQPATTVPEERPEQGAKKEGGERAFYLPVYVSFDHEAVTETMQVTPELAQSLGISYWKRGHHGKRVAFLLRHPDGRNAGCISLPVELVNELLLPPKWF